jgi:two-component system, NtrC family, response regulator AtoC
MSPLKILIADDEPELRAGLKSYLEKGKHQIVEASDGLAALRALDSERFDLLLLDVRMPQIDGLRVLETIKKSDHVTMVVIITAHASIQDAVRAVQLGAFDYLEKPLQSEKLDEILNRAIQARSLLKQVTFSSPVEKNSGETPVEFVGDSRQMRKVYDLIDRLGAVHTSVLIRGENGTGKELVAKAIHFNSPRKTKPFVAINCAAVPEDQMESEFFGHEKGAFSDAEARKIGKFQFASGGTLFLDEITELPPAVQIKLLKVLQERKITPVGSTREFNIDVRIIAATSRDLEKLMEAGDFRSDLFYKLNVMPVYLPPLRERREDIPQLVNQFITNFNNQNPHKILGSSEEALSCLRKYSWPGNIRELENAIEHAFIVEKGNLIQASSLPENIHEDLKDQEEGWSLELPAKALKLPTGERLDYHVAKAEFEKEFIIQALKAHNGRINQTSELAKIPKNTLLRKIKKYGINAKGLEST